MNYEEAARKQGWKPKEEWDGPEEQWADAKTFVERGEKIAGILKSKVERLEERIAQQERRNKEFGEYHKRQMERTRQEAEARIQELKQQQAQAVQDSDGELFTRTSDEIDRVRSTMSETPPQGNGQQQIVESWLSNNPWYNTDEKLSAYADGIADRIAAEGYTGAAYFNELTARVKRAFPEEFENKQRTKAASVEEGGEVGKTDEKDKTYANLPKDAQKACDEFVSEGFMTKEEYVKNFDWDIEELS